MPLDGFVVTLPRLPANWQTALFAKCRHYLIGISAHFSFVMDMGKTQPAVLKQWQCAQAALAAASLRQLQDGTRLEGCWTTRCKIQELRRRNETAEEWQIQG